MLRFLLIRTFFTSLLLRGLVFFFVVSKSLFGKKLMFNSSALNYNIYIYSFVFTLFFILIPLIYSYFFSLKKKFRFVETKILEIIIFSKTTPFIFSLFLISMLILFNHYSFYSVSSFFSITLGDKILPFFFNLRWDTPSLIFVRMVCFVTTLVFFYSEVYIEFYNNKKFFFITLSFFLSMRILSTRGSLMNLMIGWDGLGISSLFLIIFYPNKITFFNSFLTFFFNRLGDVLFLIFFCFSISRYRVFFHLNEVKLSWVVFLFFLCLLTKSAQFPFSSWLPAAISAPTPISAMVHSSTLVTAGIFIFFKFFSIFSDFGIFYYVLIIRGVTFIMGGFLGSLEWDLKKIVAFSTMSQIRIILFFISTNACSIAFCHTFFHALFKTLLFCGCGVVFIWGYSDQLLKNFSSKRISKSFLLFFLCRIYSMRGLIFSSSFYTKDLAIEFFLQEKFVFFFFILVLGRVFTILYSSKIFSSLRSFILLKNFFGFKASHFFFLFLFTFFGLTVRKLFLEFSFSRFFCCVRNLEVCFLNALFLILFYLKVRPYSHFRVDVFFIKNIFFRIMNKLVFLVPLSFTASDQLFFKPTILEVSKSNLREFYGPKFWFYPLLIIFFLVQFFYSFSLIERGFEATKV
jgi:NADH-ubiquinone oxidoreductase chain 5